MYQIEEYKDLNFLQQMKMVTSIDPQTEKNDEKKDNVVPSVQPIFENEESYEQELFTNFKQNRRQFILQYTKV